ncbi:MAG: sigma-70 family RNA polymerase sigma factor [Taibaiella sp.]|nr:sigma-70 family RNA polymerase sigma factor [Taibaiella sp.]
MATQDYRKISDEELVSRYAERNEHQAFAALFERYSHLVYGVCLKYLNDTEGAKDATQQIFIKLLEDLKKFSITHFKAWLYKVARNYCYMLLRKEEPVVLAENLADDMEFEDEWHQKIKEEHFLNELETAIQELSKEQRICIRYFYLQKMSYAEVARQANYDLNTVKSAIQNGKRNLKIRLAGLLEEKS